MSKIAERIADEDAARAIHAGHLFRLATIEFAGGAYSYYASAEDAQAQFQRTRQQGRLDTAHPEREQDPDWEQVFVTIWIENYVDGKWSLIDGTRETFAYRYTWSSKKRADDARARRSRMRKEAAARRKSR